MAGRRVQCPCGELIIVPGITPSEANGPAPDPKGETAAAGVADEVRTAGIDEAPAQRPSPETGRRSRIPLMLGAGFLGITILILLGIVRGRWIGEEPTGKPENQDAAIGAGNSRELRSESRISLAQEASVRSVPPSNAPIQSQGALVDGPGFWVIEGNELVKPGGKQGWIWFGDPSWRDYEFTFTMVKSSGAGGITVLFRSPRPRVGYLFTLGAPNGDTRLEFRSPEGQWWYPDKNPRLRLPKLAGKGPLPTDRPCTIRVEVRGNTCRCWHDNELMFAYDNLEVPAGMVGVRDHGQSSIRISDIQVKSLDGRVLWTGAPLPPQRDTLAARKLITDGQLVPPGGATVVVQLGHSGLVSCVAFSPDDKQVLTGSQDETVRLWDRVSGKLIRAFPGYSGFVDCVAFSPDGKLIVIGGLDKTAHLHDVASGTEIRAFEGHTRRIMAVAFSPDGKRLLTGSIDTTARLWDVASGKEVRAFAHKGAVQSVAFSPDGTMVLTGGAERTARLWDAASGQPIRAFTGGIAVAFSPDAAKVLAGNQLYDTASGRPIVTLRKPVGAQAAVFSPDGLRVLATGGQTAGLWDATTGREIAEYRGHGGAVRAVAFSPDGNHVLTGGADHTARLWDTASGNETRRLVGVAEMVLSVAFSPDGRYLLVGCGDDKARLWDAAHGKNINTFLGGTAAAFSPDGKLVLTGGYDQTARLWDAATGKKIREFVGHQLGVTSVAFSPDGTKVLTGSEDRTARLWDATTGNQIGRYESGIGKVHSVAFSPDGKTVLTGGGLPGIDSVALRWDVASGQIKSTFRGHSYPIKSVAFSPDGTQVLTGSWDRTARVWNAATGDQFRAFELPVGAINPMVWSVAFSPDGKHAATGSFDQSVRLWNIASGVQIRELKGHTALVESVAFSPDGQKLLTGSRDGTARLWETASGKPIFQLISLRDDAWTAVSPENEYMATRGGLEGVAFRVGDRVFPFDLFDLKFNRPDKIMERIGMASPQLVNAYRQLYLTRLKQMSFTEDMLGDDYHVPEVAPIAGVPLSTGEKTLKLNVQATDSKYPLDKLYVHLNGTPIYGVSGLDLRAAHAMSLQQDIEVELSSGENRFDVSVRNEKGAQSRKETVTIGCNAPARKPDMYLVAVGVSNYQAPGRSLRYASKDAGDLAAFFQSKRYRFSDVKVMLILDDDATRERIGGAKDFLSASRVDDLVVVFFAGHGLRDSNNAYYFGTADVDFDEPAKRGLSRDAIFEMLDGIRSRKKLVLLDTCYVGERADDIRARTTEKFASADVKGSRPRGGLTRPPARVEPSNSQEVSDSIQLLQELFVDLRQGTGAVILGAAGGYEEALEHFQWNNGAFTHALLLGLQDEAADQNKDGRVQVSELREFVGQQVRQLTGDQQKPTALRDNLVIDFSID